MRIVEYETATDSRSRSIDGEVRNFINLGFQPYGSPYLDRNGSVKQAMVKYEEEPLRIVPTVEGEELEPPFIPISENKPEVKPVTKPKKKGAKKNAD